MPYRLHDEVSFCEIDGRLIFLDVRSDKYFRLSPVLERILLACLDDEASSGVDAEPLIARNILTAIPATAEIAQASRIDPPRHSATERADLTHSLSAAATLDVFAAVYTTRLLLATRNLMAILTNLAEYRRSRAMPPSRCLNETDVRQLVRAAGAFRQARVYVPIAPRCLLDSLAMVRFLAGRGLYANAVFGVTSAPFAAHAWVQVRDLVLNDTVGNAVAHTPIRVA